MQITAEEFLRQTKKLNQQPNALPRLLHLHFHHSLPPSLLLFLLLLLLSAAVEL